MCLENEKKNSLYELLGSLNKIRMRKTGVLKIVHEIGLARSCVV
jgi:hypothetical protein